jgi:hypothetical protein
VVVNLIDILVILLLLVLFVYFRFFHKTEPTAAELKGLAGEQKVNDILKEHKLLFFHDVLLKQGPVSSQFDHIVVFPNKTILVIETKNKDGFIAGGSNDEKWLQVVGRNRYYFYNPIWQNEGHIKMLYKKMDKYRLYGYKILSLVVFTSDKCTLNDVPSSVIHISELPSTLNRLKKKSLFNRSRKFIRMLLSEDISRNKKEVQKHKNFAKRARYFK